MGRGGVDMKETREKLSRLPNTETESVFVGLPAAVSHAGETFSKLASAGTNYAQTQHLHFHSYSN